ncbi:MAG: PBSX family phage terminase large subunit [Alphaproteobacteria bacterium]|nr:PBSX family phage terminase large subunit [Alphaproteobacteria bacterium]MBQ9235112.1 PBSX family phage terminase large subunit [Alphaproteobacteria bacterium]
MTDNSTITARIPQIFAPLLTQKKRIKFFYGGRGGGKSYAFADSLLIKGCQKKLLIACLREVQDSIKDSVYRLLCSRIKHYRLKDYRILENKIVNRSTGSEFIFKGLRDTDAQKIKSLEGVDIAWIEEGQTISKRSWDILSPTIRKDGSEIWISMNREAPDDPLWQLLAAHPDERSLVVKVNYYDNPFCPEELKLQAEKCRRDSPDDYEHIWLGLPCKQGANQLIPPDIIRRAFEPKYISSSSSSALVIGLDVARFGDDKTVFCFRRGRSCQRFIVLEKQDVVSVADYCQNIIQDWQPARIFLDSGGVGGGVYDVLVARGFRRLLRAVNFGSRAIREDRYVNRRAEMWDNLREWLSGSLEVSLIADEDLLFELINVNKSYDAKGRLQLESKDLIKKRLGRSPDKADALALTFAEPVYDAGPANPQAASVENLFQTLSTDSKW